MWLSGNLGPAAPLSTPVETCPPNIKQTWSAPSNESMQDAHILARKYCDRWLLRVHGRGLNQRALHHRERGRQALPFAVTMPKPLS